MRSHIWIVRDENREVVGVGHNAVNAIYNCVPNCDLGNLGCLKAAYAATGEEELHHNGYTLTREPLEAPPRPAPVAWALYEGPGALVEVTTDEMAGVAWLDTIPETVHGRFMVPLYLAHPSAAAGAEVVETGYYATVGKNGKWSHNVPHYDPMLATLADAGDPSNAPHRVMRVCLKEVGRG